MLPFVNNLLNLFYRKKYLLFFLLICSSSVYSQNRYNQELQIQHDNDFLTLKRKLADRYYSFGIHLDYRKISKEDGKLFAFANKHIKNLKKIIINWHGGIEGYTSDQKRDLSVDGVVVAFDRPYAGWTFLSNKITAVNNKNLYYGKITAGVLGPISGAENVQKMFHKLINSPEFPEWKNQIQNEVAVNISGGINHFIAKSNRFDIYTNSEISIGTQATFIKQGFVGRFGIFNSIDNSFLYHTNLNNKNTKPHQELYLTLGANALVWGYKATIQGRFFGDNINMKTDGIHRLGAIVTSSINYSTGWFTTFYTFHLVSAETFRERHFYYGSLGLLFKL